MTIKCKTCGHGRSHHYKRISLTTGEKCYGHCYYPDKNHLACICSEFIPEIKRGGRGMSLSDKREEMFEWIKTQYSDKLGLDLIALIIDRIMQDDREAVRELKKNTGCNPINSREKQIVDLFKERIDKIFGEKLTKETGA